jgi:hypothetical protein
MLKCVSDREELDAIDEVNAQLAEFDMMEAMQEYQTSKQQVRKQDEQQYCTDGFFLRLQKRAECYFSLL